MAVPVQGFRPDRLATWHHASVHRPRDWSTDVFVPAVLLVAVAASYARGGRLSRLAQAPLHRPWLLFVGVAIQVTVDLLAAREVLADASALGWIGLLVSQLLVVAFIASNWHLRGIVLVAIGLLLNAIVMAANGAMPVDPAAVQALGLEASAVPLGKHTLLTDSTRLPWLADIWALPPLRSIISVGDVVLAVGLIPVTHTMMTHRSSPEHSGQAVHPEAE
jgi:hypothetical protein